MHRIVRHSDTSPPQQHERGSSERTNICTVREPAHPNHETERQRQFLVTFPAQNPQVGGEASLEHDETELDGKQDDVAHVEAVPDAEESERHHVRGRLVAEERESAEHVMAGPAARVDVKPFRIRVRIRRFYPYIKKYKNNNLALGKNQSGNIDEVG